MLTDQALSCRVQGFSGLQLQVSLRFLFSFEFGFKGLGQSAIGS